MASALGVKGTTAASAAELRKVDARAFVGTGVRDNPALMAIGHLGGPRELLGARVAWAPVRDNWSLPLLPDEAISRGKWNRVPVLVGSNADEGTLFIRELPNGMDVEGYRSLLGPSGFGDGTGKLGEAYPAADQTQILPNLQRLVGDLNFGALARLVTRAGAHAYLYQFTRVGEGEEAAAMGATHGSEIAFAFGNTPNPARGRTAYDSMLADTLSDYWVAFANTGNPNNLPGTAEHPQWPAYDPTSDPYLELGPEIGAKAGLRRPQYDALDSLAREHGAVRP